SARMSSGRRSDWRSRLLVGRGGNLTDVRTGDAFHDAQSAGLNTLLHDASRVSGDQAVRRHVLHHDARRRNHAIVAYSDPRHDHALRADITFFANPGIHVKPAHRVVGENAGAEIDRSAFANMDAARIVLVQFGRKRDSALRPDIHSPYVIEIKAAQFRKPGAQLTAHDGEDAGRAQVGEYHRQNSISKARRTPRSRSVTILFVSPRYMDSSGSSGASG